MAVMHEVDYKIFGDDMQFVEVDISGRGRGRRAGGMMYGMMASDGNHLRRRVAIVRPQVLGALVAGKRLLTGESLFATVFECRIGQAALAFSALSREDSSAQAQRHRRQLIAQKDSFLAAARA
jgi:uncharacterized protein (AIM24 family)